MIIDELHAAHKARLERMTRYAQASYEPPPPRPAPSPAPKPPAIGPMGRILQAVAKASGVSTTAIISPSRSHPVVVARHVFFWMCKTLTAKSDYAIGEFCGGRDHSTVSVAVIKIERQMSRVREMITAAKKALDDMPGWRNEP